jgi:hypothetical protein
MFTKFAISSTYVSFMHTLMDPPSFIYIIYIISGPWVSIQVVVKAEYFDMQKWILVVTRHDMIDLWKKLLNISTINTNDLSY